jgi:C-terminal processing protease CtpA/Prc
MTAKLYTLIGLSCLVFACKKTATPPEPTGPVTSKEINQWVCDSMKRYSYYSNGLNLLTDKNQGTLSYFQSLKSVNDRFSFIENQNGESSLPKSSRSMYGFDYLIFKESKTNEVFGMITMVMNDSPAKRAGLLRGMFFSKINGVRISDQNAEILSNQITNRNYVKLRITKITNTIVEELNEITVNLGITWGETLIDNTFVEAGKKIGYLYLSSFRNIDRNKYVEIFDTFKTFGVKELILDLRYNSGGDVSAAANICSMLSSNIMPTSVFIKYEGNNLIGKRDDSFSKAVSLENGRDFIELQSKNLNLDRIFILSTKTTASASEIIINNLKPYLNVIHIGEKTFGKDEAFVLVYDRRNSKRINYFLYPAVYKVFNGLGIGNYSNGLNPTYSFLEISELPLKELGNKYDPMINNCFSRITGKLPANSIKTNTSNFTNGTFETPVIYYNSAEKNVDLNRILVK